jgi:hypothetical protein
MALAAGMRAAVLALAAWFCAASLSPAQEPPQLEPLGEQRAPAGVCGSYLWSRAPGQRDRELLAVATPSAVLVRLDGALRAVRLARADRMTVAGHHARQRFADQEITVELRMVYARGRHPGAPATIPSGLIILTGRQGWQSIAPVSGWVAC